MITIGVDNTSDMGKDTLDFIYDIAQKQGIKMHHITANKPMIYKNNKILSIKNYVDYLNKEQGIDLLLIELNKNNIEQELCRSIYFDIIVLFDCLLSDKHPGGHKVYFEQKVLKQFRSKLYLIPDTYNIKGKSCITYGWHKDADISLSSAEEDLDGIKKIQCYIQTCLLTKQGTYISQAEFPVCGKARYTEELLAGAAVFILYGFDASAFVS